MNKKLSILIPSIESRKDLLSELVCGLIQQCGIIKSMSTDFKLGCTVLIVKFDDVEIIVATDNKQISTGKKRQLLLELANNDFVIATDDDDFVPYYFVSEILDAIQSDYDVYATNGTITTNMQDEMQWFLSKDNPNTTVNINGKNCYLRTSNHLSPCKRELALLAGYEDKSNGEDFLYSNALNLHLKTEGVIDKPLYWYRYSTFDKQY